MIDERLKNLSKNTIDLINEAYENDILDVKEKFKSIVNYFFNFLKNASLIENQSLSHNQEFKLQFTSNIARIQFLIAKYNLPEDLVNVVLIVNRLKKIYQKSIDSTSLDKLKDIIFNFLSTFAETNNSKPFVNQKIETTTEKHTDNLFKFKSIESIKINSFKYLLTCFDRNLQEIKILLTDKFEYLRLIPQIETLLLITDIELTNTEKNLYKQTQNTKIVMEPGYLVDITDIAECFQFNYINPLLYFKKNISEFTVNQGLSKGNLVNHIFDNLISNPTIDFETAFKLAVKNRPLTLIASLFNSVNGKINDGKKLKEAALDLKKIVYENFCNLQQVVPSIELGNYIVEPSFISETNGLQGRLDLLINKEQGEKNVIELKSGKFPDNNLKISYLPTDSFINVWTNHYAQANGYNMLLDDVFEKRRGTSAILYSLDNQKPLRNVSNIHTIKDLILNTRNRIIILIKQIVTNDIDFEWIAQKILSLNLKIINSDYISKVYDNLEIGEWQYINDCFRFIVTEEYLQKLRNNIVRLDLVHNDQRLSIYSDSFQILSKLTINFEESDFTANHLTLNSREENVHFHEGDQIFLYPDEFITKPTKFYILKGFVREANNKQLKISLISKSIDLNLFRNYTSWTLEIDKSDDLNRRQFQLLTKFIFSPKEYRKKVMYGYQNNYDHKKIKKFKYLNNKQQKLVQRAINHKDYFLIQGPPGTGKTSRILRAIVEYYFKYTDTKIVLMAPTNRAVDEICQTLDKIEPNFPFLRISSKNIENYTERSIPFLSEKLNINELMQLILKTRVFVGTISAFLNNLDLLQFVKLELLIIDEASQVVETEINGFLATASKFIIIGDTNQLPAITNQEKFLDYNLSTFFIFERLLAQAQESNRIAPIGQLGHQGRLHKRIQDLANFLTYDDSLYTINLNQLKEEPPEYLINFEHPWLSDRIVFIDTPADTDIKSNRYEARLISKFLQDYFRYLGSDIPSQHIGVISPFRKQCNLIRNLLPPEISSKVTIDTVERYQGSERDIIIYSFSLNHKIMLDKISSPFFIGTKIIDRKFNVATTRAKDYLIMLGNTEVLSKSEYYRKVLDWIATNGSLIKIRNIKKPLIEN